MAFYPINVGESSGGGGHTILDDNGTSLAQESNLQFRGAYSRDDSTNGKTVVEVSRSMTKAEFDQLTEAEKTGIINVTDEEELPWKDITGVLPAGETEIILSDDAITVNSTFEAFTDPIEVSHTDMVLVNEPSLINDILSSADDTKVTSSSSDSADVAPWKAFDGIKGVSSGAYASPYYSWLAGNGDAPCWLQYHFATAKYIDEVKVYVYCNNGTYTGSAKIQGSNDGTSWTDISSAVSISAPYGEEIELDFTCNGSRYSYVRLYSESAFTVYGGASIFVGEMEIYGRNSANGIKLTFPAQTENLNVKVRITDSGNSSVGGGGGSIDYSTEEQDTGIKWIDGSAIYQKTIYSAGGTTGVTEISHGISNLAHCIYAEGFFHDTYDGGFDSPLPKLDALHNDIGITEVTSTSVKYNVPSVYGDGRIIDIYITLRYTKSTT